MRLTSRLAFMATLLISATIAAAADESYPFKIARPFKAGDAYDLDMIIDNSRTSVITRQGAAKETTTEAFKGDITGRVDVAEVDARGNEKVFSLTVKKFTGGPEGKELVESGKIIDVKRTDQKVDYTMRGGASVSTEIQDILGQFCERLNNSPVTDDEVFGSATPHKAGESWPVDAALAAQQATGSGVQIDPKKIAGQTTFKGVEMVAGTPALRLATTMNMTDAKPTGMPDTYTFDTCEVKSMTTSLLSTDITVPPLEREMNLETKVVIKVAGAEPLTLEVSDRQQEQSTITLVKK